MTMVIGVFLMLLGALGPIAAVQWRSGHWLEGARWIARNSSVHLLYAVPIAGLLVACVGLSIMWPPAIVLVFLSAGAFMWALLTSPHRRRTQAAHEPAVAADGTRTQARVSGPFSTPPDGRRQGGPVRGRARPGRTLAEPAENQIVSHDRETAVSQPLMTEARTSTR